MGAISSEINIRDGVTSVMSKIEDSVVSTITAYEQAGAAADQMAASAGAAADHAAASAGAADQAAATTGAAIDQMSASVGALSDYTDYWTAAVGNYDTSALRAINTTQELVDMGYMSADALQAEAEAARVAAEAQAAAAETARRGTQEQQKLAQTVQSAATSAYQKATSALTNNAAASDICAARIKDVERQLFSQSQKLSEANALYAQLVGSSGAASNEAEKQRAVVEKLTDALSACTAQHEELSREMEELTSSEKNVSEETENATRGFRDSGNAANMAANGGISNLIRQIGSLAAGYISLRAAMGFVDDAMGNQTSGLQLQAFMGDDIGSSATAWAKQTANQMGRVYSDIFDSATRLTKLGFSGTNIQALTDLSNRLAWFTKDNDYSAMSNAIQQAFRTGRTESLSSALDLSKNALEGFGITEAIEAGNMNAFIDALERATEAAGMTQEAVQKITAGDEAQWERFKNNVINNVTEAANGFLDTFSPVFGQLNAWLESDNAQVFFAGLTAAFQVAGMVASAFVNLLMNAANWIADNWQTVMMGAAILVGIFAVKMLLAAVSAAAFNARLLIIVGLAVAAGMAMYNMGLTVEEVAGTIAGIIGVMAAFVYNRFVDVWNFIALFVNFFANCFNDPVTAIKVLFYDLCAYVVGLVGDMAGAIETLLNKIPGVKVDLTSGIDNLYNSLKDAAEKAKSEGEWIEYVKSVNYWEYEDAWDSGYSFGENLVSGIEDALSGIADGLGGTYDGGLNNYPGTGVSDMSDILGKINDDTANIASTVSNASEAQLKYLKEIAERQGIDNTTSITVNVEMNNNNQISSDTDIDGFLNALTEQLGEAIAIEMEGVTT